LLVASGNAEAGAAQAQQALSASAGFFGAYEVLGDAEAARGRAAEARAAYQSALDLEPERADRKRIEGKRGKVR